MKITQSIRCSALAFVFGVLLAGAASAHTELTASIPVDGTEVSSVASITLEFRAAVRLARVELTRADGTTIELPLDRDAPAAKQNLITLAEPLGPGEYTVRWRAIADDGHVLTGEFGFTVRPS